MHRGASRSRVRLCFEYLEGDSFSHDATMSNSAFRRHAHAIMSKASCLLGPATNT